MYNEKTSRNFYIILIIFLALSLPLSVFSTSAVEILLAMNWIAEGNFRKKMKLLHERQTILIIASLYLLYLAGLFYSTDFTYGLHSLKIKLPLLALPLIIGTSEPFSVRELKIILLSFISGTLISSFFSAVVFFGAIPYSYNDVREISIFISHIRFSLMIVFSLFILIYFLFADTESEYSGKGWKIVFSIACIWFAVFLFLLKSLTGLIIFAIVFFIVTWTFSGKIEEIAPRFIIRVFLLIMPLSAISFFTKSISKFYHREDIDFSNLDSLTYAGNPYYHDTLSTDAENGYFVWIYLSEKELRESWNEQSEYKYDDKDKRGQDMKYTLIRYLTSKGLRKDATGINHLNKKDIEAIENGLTNFLFTEKYSLYPRMYEILWEIDNHFKGKEPGDHSVSQRIVYFKAAWSIFLKYPFFGTGTGDVRDELDKYYEKEYPSMPEHLRKPAHNQFLTILMTFGIFGFIISLNTILLPIFIERKWNNYLLKIFLLIMILSMFADDTLETQTGISLFMFFYSLLVFGIKKI